MLDDGIWCFGPKNCKIDIFVAEFRFHLIGIADAARSQDTGRRPALSRRIALQSQLHSAVAAKSFARSYCILPRGRNFCCGCAPSAWLSTSDLRFGSRA